MPRALRLVTTSLAIVLVGGLVVWLARDVLEQSAATPGPAPAARPGASASSAGEGGDAAEAPVETPVPLEGAEDGLFTSLFPEDDPAWAWARVDLDALRAELPDNAFWELAAPTNDPAVLEARREARARANDELGKVMSNTGSESEVRAYYAERQRISSDYVTFTTRLIERYGDVLPERDLGLIELARRMHRTRLEELPRRLAEALERREAHARVREAWLAEEAAFAGPDAGADGGTDAVPGAADDAANGTEVPLDVGE